MISKHGLNLPQKKCPAEFAGARIDLSGLFPAQGTLQTANGILHFASNLLGLAFSFQLLIAEQFSPTSFTAPLACSRSGSVQPES